MNIPLIARQIEFATTGSHAVHALATIKGTKLVALGEEQPNQITIWNTETNEKQSALVGHTAAISSLASSLDYLASGGYDNNVMLWKLSEQSLVTAFQEHERRIVCLQFSPDGNILASADADGKIKFWDVNSRTHLVDLIGHEDSVTNITFSSDGQTLTSSSYDGKLKLWDVNTGEIIKTLFDYSQPIVSTSHSPDWKYIAIGGENAFITVINMHGQVVKSIPTAAYEEFSLLAFVKDRVLVTGYYREDYLLKFWDMETGKATQIVNAETDELYSMAFDASQKLLICGGGGKFGGTIEWWKIA